MTEELQKKVEQAVKLIKAAGADGETVEVAYSGGKDSDVCLELTRMAGIKYRAIYHNTTIDPPGTIKHVKEQGAEVMQPKVTFFELVAQMGFPNQFQRHCCRYLKEYKTLDRTIQGIRKCESTRRAANYEEPTECRVYGRGRKKEYAEAFYPILDWTDEDVAEFIAERGIKCHPLYYDEEGNFHVDRRLGCMCCPMAYYRKRIEYFKSYPGMVKAYLRAGQKYRDRHPDVKTTHNYRDVYEWFTREIFFEKQSSWENHCTVSQFAPPNYKLFIERYFGIELNPQIVNKL